VNILKVYLSAKSWFLKYKQGLLHGYIMKSVKIYLYLMSKSLSSLPFTVYRKTMTELRIKIEQY